MTVTSPSAVNVLLAGGSSAATATTTSAATPLSPAAASYPTASRPGLGAAGGAEPVRPRESASRRLLEEAGILVEAGGDAARAQQWRDELYAELSLARAQRESVMVRPVTAGVE
jgi:hypothetical protein